MNLLGLLHKREEATPPSPTENRRLRPLCFKRALRCDCDDDSHECQVPTFKLGDLQHSGSADSRKDDFLSPCCEGAIVPYRSFPMKSTLKVSITPTYYAGQDEVKPTVLHQGWPQDLQELGPIQIPVGRKPSLYQQRPKAKAPNLQGTNPAVEDGGIEISNVMGQSRGAWSDLLTHAADRCSHPTGSRLGGAAAGLPQGHNGGLPPYPFVIERSAALQCHIGTGLPVPLHVGPGAAPAACPLGLQ